MDAVAFWGRICFPWESLVGLIAVGLLHLAMAAPPKRDPRPEVIEITPSGQVFTNRFHGRYPTSLHLLAIDLKGGCYNGAKPARVSSVHLTIAKNAPEPKVKQVWEILVQQGWPREKVQAKYVSAPLSFPPIPVILGGLGVLRS